MPPGATRPGGLFLIQRLDAADQLGDLPAFLWNKTDSDAWLKMNAAVRRLAITLDLAGFDLTERLRASAIAFWERVHTSLDEISAVVAELLGTNRRIKSWWVGRRVRRLLHEWDHAEQALLRSIDKSGE